MRKLNFDAGRAVGKRERERRMEGVCVREENERESEKAKMEKQCGQIMSTTTCT